MRIAGVRPPAVPIVLLMAALLASACAGDPSVSTSGRRTTIVPTTTTVAPATTVAPPETTTTAPAGTSESTAAAAPTVVPATAAPPPPAPILPAGPLPSGNGPVLLAAGDIASCSSTGDEATAALLAGLPGTVITLGDNVYESGTSSEFASCYDPSWGAQLGRTRPSPGNHDYGTGGAGGYFAYFGAAAGDPGRGYYSYDLGGWHVVSLNSNCSTVSCAPGGAQETWLRADLAAHPAACTVAYWHHPRFSSGTVHGSSTTVQPLWQALYDFGADLVLQGHEHNYERFGPLDPSGRIDAARGIRSFVAGTGGRSHYGFGSAIAGSEVRNGTAFGVLAITLRPTAFDWQFVPVAGQSFTDSGSAACH